MQTCVYLPFTQFLTDYNKNNITKISHWEIYKHYTYSYAEYILQTLSTPARTGVNLLNTQLHHNCKNHQISMQGYLNFAHAF